MLMGKVETKELDLRSFLFWLQFLVMHEFSRLAILYASQAYIFLDSFVVFAGVRPSNDVNVVASSTISSQGQQRYQWTL